MSVLSFFASVGLSAASLSAATYYVSLEGSNTNVGSETQPWRTIQKAADTVNPGDTVIIRPGNYGERVDISRAATTNQPITFQSEGAETGGFNVRKSDYVIRGFRLNGRDPSMSSASALVYVYKEAHRIQVLDNHLYNATNKHGVWFLHGRGNPSNSSSFNVVSNNTFAGIDYVNVTCSGISNRFTRNIFKDSNGQADTFRFWGEGHIASDNLITNLSQISENHTDFFQTFGPQNPRDTNDLNYVRNIVLERNVIVNSRIQICQLETFDNPPGNMTNLIFRNNLFINIPYAANVDMDGTKWVNNVFYRCNYWNGGHVFALGGPKGSAYGTEIINNAFVECGNGEDWVGWYPRIGQFGITNYDLRADHNFVCGKNGQPKNTSLPDGWGSNGQEAHSINGGDPGFVSALAYNFYLRGDSVLINKGAALSGFTDDLYQNSRNDGRWDIGAHEYQSGPSAPRNLRIVPE